MVSNIVRRRPSEKDRVIGMLTEPSLSIRATMNDGNVAQDEAVEGSTLR